MNKDLEFDLVKLRGLLLWTLYHHQGANSEVGLPIRKSLGIGRYDAMTIEQIKEAKIAGGVMSNTKEDEIGTLEWRNGIL